MLDQNQFITTQDLRQLHLRALMPQGHPSVEMETRRVEDRVAGRVRQGRVGMGMAREVHELLEKRKKDEMELRRQEGRKKKQERLLLNQLLFPNGRLKTDVYPPEIFSPEQHKKFIRSVSLQQKKIDTFRHQIKQIHVQHESSRQQMERQESERKRQAEIQRKKQQIQQKLKKMRQNHEQLLNRERESQAALQQARKKKRLYQKLQESFHRNVELPTQQEQERRLKEIKESAHLDLKEIEHHQQEYLQWKEQQKHKKQKKEKQKTEEYHPPPHSPKMSRLLQLETNKTIQEQLGKEELKLKLIRKQQYSCRWNSPTNHILNQLVLSNLPNRYAPQLFKHSNQYLQQSKQLRKRAKTQQRCQQLESSPKVSQRNTETLSLDYIPVEQRKAYIHKMKRLEVEQILKDKSLSSEEKLRRIKMTDEGVSRELEERRGLDLREEGLQLLLATIKAKLALIAYYDS